MYAPLLPHDLTTAWHFEMWIPNIGVLPIILSVSLTHVPCLYACFYECVSCGYAFFSTCLSICVSRAACFVLWSVFIITFFNLKIYFYIPIAVHIALPICLSSFSACIFIRASNVYVHFNSYTHFPPSPRNLCLPLNLHPYLYSHVYIFTLASASISPCSHSPVPLYSWVFIFQYLFVHFCLFLQQSVPTPST